MTLTVFPDFLLKSLRKISFLFNEIFITFRWMRTISGAQLFLPVWRCLLFFVVKRLLTLEWEIKFWVISICTRSKVLRLFWKDPAIPNKLITSILCFKHNDFFVDGTHLWRRDLKLVEEDSIATFVYRIDPEVQTLVNVWKKEALSE